MVRRTLCPIFLIGAPHATLSCMAAQKEMQGCWEVLLPSWLPATLMGSSATHTLVCLFRGWCSGPFPGVPWGLPCLTPNDSLSSYWSVKSKLSWPFQAICSLCPRLSPLSLCHWLTLCLTNSASSYFSMILALSCSLLWFMVFQTPWYLLLLSTGVYLSSKAFIPKASYSIGLPFHLTRDIPSASL